MTWQFEPSLSDVPCRSAKMEYMFELMEDMREEILDRLSEIEIAALDQDLPKFRELWEKQRYE